MLQSRWSVVAAGISMCMVLASGQALQAQTFQGGIRGAVRDADGILPGVEVTLTNDDTGARRSTFTNDVGEYNFPAVAPGPYTLRAFLQGFQTYVRNGLVIATQQFVTLDVTLAVGSVQEEIQVTAAAPLIETTNASHGTVLDRQQLESLPAPGRNAFYMAITLPTVVHLANPEFVRQNAQSGASLISIGGGAVRANNYLLDGVQITDMQNRSVANVSMEALQDVNIQVHTFDAEMGRTGGGVFNATSRSGANQFHGSAFFQTRPIRLATQNFFLSRQNPPVPKADEFQRIYGYGLGGPIVTNRTFWWASMEQDNANLTRDFTQRFATDLERAGDFSQTVDRNGNLIVIYDPLTTQTDPATGNLIRDAFPGNIIPADRISTVGSRSLSFAPDPDVQVSNEGPNRTVQGEIPDRARQWTAKITHNVTDSISLSGLGLRAYTREEGNNSYPRDEPLFASPMFQLDRLIKMAVINNTNILNDSTVLTFRGGWNEFDDSLTSVPFDPRTLGFDPSFTNDITRDKFPEFNAAGYPSMGHAPWNERVWGSYSMNGTVSKLAGRHSLKMGASFRRMWVNSLPWGEASGDFSFNRQFTRGPDPLSPARASGSSIAEQMLGYPSRGEAAWASNLEYSLHYFGAYIQDDVRATDKLSLNYGLRLESETGIHEKQDRFTVGFDRHVVNPISSLVTIPGRDAIRGGLLYAGVDGNPTLQGDLPAVKLSPRVGAAYSINDLTVLRGGYGIFYAPWSFPGPSTTNYGNIGYNQVTSLQQDALIPITTLDNPFPNGLLQPVGNAQGLLTGVGENINFIDQDKGSQRVQQYTANLQRQLPFETAISVTYVGSKGTDMSFGGSRDVAININQLPVSAASLGSSLFDSVPNPFFGVPEAGAFGERTTLQRGQLLRPFPQYNAVRQLQTTGGRTKYDAFIVQFTKRVSNSWWGGRFSYTRSKLQGNQFGQFSHYVAPAELLNNYDTDAEYGLSVIDIPHRVLMNPIVRLPFGEGRRFANTPGTVANYLLSGWTASASLSWQTGFPLAIRQSPNNSGLFGSAQRPNRVPGVNPIVPGGITGRLDRDLTDNQYLNPAAWSQAAPFTFGNAPAVDGDARTPSQFNLNMAVQKDFATGGGSRFQFRFEILNATNTVKFRRMGQVWGTGSFGQINSQAAYMRVVAIMTRFTW